MLKYDVIIIGSGPGGYVAAIRASQLGFKTAVVEKAELGGICLNWGCIPTKALMKSAQVYTYLKNAENYGIKVEGEIKPDFDAIIQRSRNVSANMSKGIQYLMKKNNIDVLYGYGKIGKDKTVSVTGSEGEVIYKAQHIILATELVRVFYPIFHKTEKIIGYREALTLPQLPESWWW